MKLIDILEARKNPHLNPKYTTLDQLKQITTTYPNDEVFVRFSGHDKLGHNPKHDHNTPFGICAYPIKYAIETISNIPYAGSCPHIIVFKIKPSANIWYLSKQLRQDTIDKIAKSTGLYIPNVKNTLTLQSTIKTPKELWYWMYTNINTATGSPDKLARRILTNAGFDGVIDGGDGIIHINEPTQAIFFNPRAIRQIDSITNDAAKLINVSTILKTMFNNKLCSTREELFEFLCTIYCHIVDTVPIDKIATAMDCITKCKLIDDNFPTFKNTRDVFNWLHSSNNTGRRYLTGGLANCIQVLTKEDCKLIGTKVLTNYAHDEFKHETD